MRIIRMLDMGAKGVIIMHTLCEPRKLAIVNECGIINNSKTIGEQS